MMNNELSSFLQQFKEVVDENKKFLFFTLGIEFQKQAIAELESHLTDLLTLKTKMIENKDEESANILLSLENFLLAIVNELKMLISLKEDRMDEAWQSLVKAQSSLRTSLQASDIVLDFDGKNYVNKLFFMERLFFHLKHT